MPKGSKVDAAETALKAGARKKGLKGKRADAYVYGTLNNMGFKRGNATTSKGAQRVIGGLSRPPKSTTMGS